MLRDGSLSTARRSITVSVVTGILGFGFFGCTSVSSPKERVDGPTNPDGVTRSGGTTGLDAINRVGGADAAAGAGGATGGAAGSRPVDAPVVPDAPAPPDAFVPLPVGSECSGNSTCAGGNCVDGICCDKACADCYACKQTFTGKPNGTCAAVVTGKDPHEACADETDTNQCGNDGQCDGAGACRKVSTSHSCQDALCSGSVFTPSSTCDGAGACKTVIPEDCAPFQCAVTGCLKTCASQADCGATNYCNMTTGRCAAKLGNGKPATQVYECTSGVVADGVCCNLACTGCNACSGGTLTNGAAGQCLPVVAGQVAHNACTASVVPCGLDGKCDGIGACRFSPLAGQSCDDSDLCTTGRTCQAGQCKGGTTKTCTTPPACYSGTGTCSPSTGNCTYTTKVADGASSTCNDNNPCTTDTCKDGVCSSTPIACSSAPACHSNSGSTCSGGTCSYPLVPVGTSCGTAASCANGMLTPGQTCSSTGSCGSGGSAQPCANGYLCNAAGTGCSSTCSPNGCAAGYYCSGSSCVAKKGKGADCSANSDCASAYCVNSFCCENACSLSTDCMACSSALTGQDNGNCRVRTGSPKTPCPETNPTACVDLSSSDAGTCPQVYDAAVD